MALYSLDLPRCPLYYPTKEAYDVAEQMPPTSSSIPRNVYETDEEYAKYLEDKYSNSRLEKLAKMDEAEKRRKRAN